MIGEHACDERCSWRATPDSIRALGYDLRVPRQGDKADDQAVHLLFVRLRHDAWLDGHLRICTKGDA